MSVERFYPVNDFRGAFMIRMGHIDSDNVHTRFVQGLEAFEARCGRTDSANDFGSPPHIGSLVL